MIFFKIKNTGSSGLRFTTKALEQAPAIGFTSTMLDDLWILAETFTIEVKKCNYDQLIQYCVDNEGNSYGHLQNIGLFISNIFGLKKNIFSKGYNCSEEIGKILQLEGYRIDKDLNLLTPRDIELILIRGK